MKSIQELLDDRTHKIKSAEDIVARADKENRPLTTEETNTSNQYLAEADTLKAEVEKLKAQEALRNRVQTEVAALAEPVGRKTAAVVASEMPADTGISVRVNGYTRRFGALKAFVDPKNGELHAFKAGQWLLATFFGSGKAKRWCEQNGVDFRASMSEGTNTAGGNLVPDEMSQAIIDLREQYGVFRQHARVRPMSSDVQLIPRVSGHVTASFTAEAAAINASDMTIDQVQLVAQKLGCLTYLSTELNEDAVISVVDQLTKDMAYAFALKEDQCGFIGDGSATYGGMRGLTNLFTASSRAGAIDAASGHDTFAEIDAADLAALMGALPEYARINAKFYASRVATESVFGRVKAMAGGNNVQTLQGTIQDNYLGYPIVTSQVLPTSTGDLSDVAMLFFGDLSMSSSVGERRGITVRRSDEIKFVEDQIALKATERVDIVNHDVGNASVAGPIVALIGE